MTTHPPISAAEPVQGLNNGLRRSDGNPGESWANACIYGEAGGGEKAPRAEQLRADREPNVQRAGAVPERERLVHDCVQLSSVVLLLGERPNGRDACGVTAGQCAARQVDATMACRSGPGGRLQEIG